MVNPKVRTLWRLRKGGRIFCKQGARNNSGNKKKYFGDTRFKTVLIFVKFTLGLLALPQ